MYLIFLLQAVQVGEIGVRIVRKVWWT